MPKNINKKKPVDLTINIPINTTFHCNCVFFEIIYILSIETIAFQSKQSDGHVVNIIIEFVFFFQIKFKRRTDVYFANDYF